MSKYHKRKNNLHAGHSVYGAYISGKCIQLSPLNKMYKMEGGLHNEQSRGWKIRMPEIY